MDKAKIEKGQQFLIQVKETALALGLSPVDVLDLFGLFAQSFIESKTAQGAERAAVTAFAIEIILGGIGIETFMMKASAEEAAEMQERMAKARPPLQ